MRRGWRNALIGLGVVAVGIQFVPVRRDNPPATASLVTLPAVEAVLKRSCYDCHSNETRWPWYSHVAPVSWLVAGDVHEGRHHMDFSRWGELPPSRRDVLLKEIRKLTEKGDMPPPRYLLMHRAARLSAEDQRILDAWITSRLGPETGREGGEQDGEHAES
jgi:hypothetical protein